MLKDLGQLTDARALINEALRLDPSSSMHYDTRAKIYERMGEYDLARLDQAVSRFFKKQERAQRKD